MLNRELIGMKLPLQPVDVEKGRLLFFAKAIGQTDPIYIDESSSQAAGHQSLLAPPTFLMVLRMESLGDFNILDPLGIDIGKLLHAEEYYRYHKPVVAGDKIRFEGELSDMYEKNNGKLDFFVQEYKAFNQHNELVGEIKHTLVVRN